MKPNNIKSVTLELNATAFLTKHGINFDPNKELLIIPNKGRVYKKTLDEMTVRELLLSDGIDGNGLVSLITICRGKGHNQVIKIFAALLRDLTD